MRSRQGTFYKISNSPISIGMGNVLSTVSDKKIPVDNGNNGPTLYQTTGAHASAKSREGNRWIAYPGIAIGRTFTPQYVIDCIRGYK